jgi:5-methylcytosine-specific restriction endonuclease McrA
MSRGNDPRFTAQYRANRAILKARRDPECARCGGLIDYDGARFHAYQDMRVENPWAFDAGHIIDVALGGDNSLGNLQAEHVRCSRKAGSMLGHARRWGSKKPKRPTTAYRW